MTAESTLVLILLILCLLFQGFFTMAEMAFVSFNRIRLAYYAEKQKKEAVILKKLLDHPTILFSTTLIGVNFFLQLGSESSRIFLHSIGFDPDIAYFPQVVMVLLFAELIPMIIARDHSEHIAMLTIKPIYFLSKIFSPLIYLIEMISKIVIFFLKSELKVDHSLSRDELKNLLTDTDRQFNEYSNEDFEPLVENIFSLKLKTPRQLMTPIEKIFCISYHTHVGEVRDSLTKVKTKYIPVYHETKENIFGIIYSQDLLNLPDSFPIKDLARSPWFVIETNTIFQVINQFRKNNQKISIVLDENGRVLGVLSLSAIVDEIFSGILFNNKASNIKSKVYVDKMFSADTKIREISDHYKLPLDDFEKSNSRRFNGKAC